ncbi:MAG: SelT/SelW/SelH family protein [Chloroflexi bacterium]|nr:SelT/SelW/SelH family protein [Chloroflexota bacterium]
MADNPAKVSITYCAHCGYEGETLGLVRALMYEFPNDLTSIEIVPWDDGAFEVSIGGRLVHSMYRDGGFPEHETIKEAVRAHIAGEA